MHLSYEAAYRAGVHHGLSLSADIAFGAMTVKACRKRLALAAEIASASRAAPHQDLDLIPEIRERVGMNLPPSATTSRV